MGLSLSGNVSDEKVCRYGIRKFVSFAPTSFPRLPPSLMDDFIQESSFKPAFHVLQFESVFLRKRNYGVWRTSMRQRYLRACSTPG